MYNSNTFLTAVEEMLRAYELEDRVNITLVNDPSRAQVEMRIAGNFVSPAASAVDKAWEKATH